MVTRSAVHTSARADCVLEPVRRQRDARSVDQREVLADALVCDEKPVCGDPAALHRLHAAADRAERGAALAASAELEPRVAEPLIVRMLATEKQIPLHPFARVGVGLDAVCGEVAVEQERKRERQHLRLAGPVVAAQQQSPVAERELLLVVVEEIDEPQPQRLPALAGRCVQAAHAIVWVSGGSVGVVRPNRASAGNG